MFHENKISQDMLISRAYLIKHNVKGDQLINLYSKDILEKLKISLEC